MDGIGVPDAFLAKILAGGMQAHIHTAMPDAAVMTGKPVMISAVLRQLFRRAGPVASERKAA